MNSKYDIVSEDFVKAILLTKINKIDKKITLIIKNQETFKKFKNEFELKEHFVEKIESAINKINGFTYKCISEKNKKAELHINQIYSECIIYTLNMVTVETKEELQIKTKLLEQKIKKLTLDDSFCRIATH